MGTAARVYAEQLAKFEFGQALWWPEPTRAPNGQPHEPEIGDVGYIDEDGAFQVLFNVSHSADHESHAGPPPIPRCFVPLDYDRNLVETKERFCTTGPLYSSGVRSQRMQSLLSADVPNMPVGGTLSYRFKCNRQQGAFLMLWDDATKTVVQKQERKFEEYMLHHHQSWVDYATDTKYLGLRRKPEDIILVRGTIKTSSWTVGAFFGDGREDHEVALEGRLGPVVNVSFQYALHESSECSPVPPRSGPAHRVSSTDITTNSSHLLTNPAGTSDIAEHTANKKDQCVFLSFYKMKYRRLFPRQIRAAADVFGGGNIGGTEDEDRIYNSVSEDSAGVETEFTGSTARSPLDDILDYILETSTAAMAITSHKDLQALTPVLSDDWPSTFSAFLRQTLPDVVVDHSGVGRVHMEELLISPGAKRESPSLLHSMPAVITNSITSQDYPGPPGTRSSSYGSAYHHALVPEEDITFSNTQGSTRAPPESVMRPNNFNTSLVNRMSQLSHQNQVGIPVQNIMGNATVDQARMWRQMQQIQQIQQHQQHMPLRAQGTGDEFKEMLRSQSIARQPQQHMHQDNQHQLFGLTGRKGGSSQMHDQNPQTMRQPQSRLDALSQAFAQRNIPMNITRQFDMLAQSQSQQQQQGPPPNAASFALLQYQQQQQRAQLQQAALQQQQQQYLRQQGMMAGQGAQGNFSPAAQNMSQLADGGAQRFAGGVLANQPALTQQQQQQQQQNAAFQSPQSRAMALATLRQRYPVVQGQLQDLERQLALVQSPAMLHKSEGERHQESDRLMKEIEQKKEMLQKIHSMTTALVADLQATTKQQPHQKPGPNQPPNWMPQPAQSPANAHLQPNGAQISAQPQQQPNMPSLTPQLSGQPNRPLPQQPPTLDSQNGLHGQPPTHASPALTNSAQNMLNGAGRNAIMNTAQMNQLTHLQRHGSFPALPLPAFESAFKEWCNKQNIQINSQLLNLEDGKKINLHKLHAEVIAAGTVAQLGDNLDKWAIIGGKMGFVQLNGDPPRSGPAIANRLLHVYREYLQQFDLMYLKSSLQKKLQQTGPAAQQPDMNSGNPPAGPSNPPGAQQHEGLHNNMQGLASLFNTADPTKIQQLLNWSRFSSDQLRAMNVPQDVINMIDINRPILTRQLSAQAQFHEGVKANNNMNALAAMQQQQRQQQLMANQAGMRQTPMNAVPGPSGMQPMQPQNNAQPGGMTMPNRTMNPAMRPSSEDLQRANAIAQRLRQEARAYRAANIPNAVMIPEVNRSEYNAHFEQLVRSITDLDSKLPFVIMAFGEQQNLPKKLAETTATVHLQRQILGSNTPRYIIDGPSLRQMSAMVSMVQEAIMKRMQGQGPRPGQPQFTGPPQPQLQPPFPQPHTQSHQPQPQASSPPNATMHVPSAPSMGIPSAFMQQAPHPQSMPPPLAPTPQPQPQPSPRPQPTPVLSAATTKKKQQGAENAASPAAASTPVANAPTPTHVNSPSTPKSPKPKSRPKPVPKRKASTAKVPPAAGPSTAPPPAPTATAPVSASTPVSAATPSAMDQSSPAAATPESTGTKRRREEEATSSAPAPIDAPSPKKARTDWDGPVNAELVKKKEEVDALQGQSDEDAVKFFESMKEMLNMASNDESAAEIANALASVISGYSDPMTSGDGGLGTLGDLGTSSPSANNVALGDGLEFFDFTSYSSAFDDDTGSKAVTPDLLQATSTNPSPRSGSESDHVQSSNVPDTATIVEPKMEDGTLGLDPLRLGIWKEIDGGIGSYHQPGDGWKWDGSMPTSEQPWAIVSQP